MVNLFFSRSKTHSTSFQNDACFSKKNQRISTSALVEEPRLLKDRIRQPEGSEWESIKILYKNLIYVSKQIQCVSSNSIETT
jgi:hypothetical protein